MDFELQDWLALLLQKLLHCFSGRLRFVGLQGSQGRKEATAQSDIDVVVILDQLGFEDLKAYRAILSAMPEREKACGFISGVRELSHWPRHDIFTFYYDTKPLYGSLDGILSRPDVQEAEAAVKSGVANLYHQLCHTYLFDEAAPGVLKDLYKHAFFILQALYFTRQHVYVPTRLELSEVLSGLDKDILDTYLQWPEGLDAKQEALLYHLLLTWCSGLLE